MLLFAKRTTFGLKLVLMGLLVFSAMMAQGQDELDFAEMSLEDLLNVEVTVASKSEETIADAPSTVTVFSRQEIQAMGISTLSELLNFVPGFQAARDVENGDVTTVTSRGRRSGALSIDILYLMNGIRLNEAHTGSANYINRLITLDNIKQVEVIRGPGSALYGSNAFTGVVNIVTIDNVKEVNLKAGSLSTRDMWAAYNGEVGTWNYSAFVRSFSDQGQVYEGVGSAFVASNDTTDPRKGFDFNVSLKSKKIELNLRHQERELDDFYVFGYIQNGLNHEKTTQSSFNIKYAALNTDNSSLDISVAAVKSKFDQMTRLVENTANPVFAFLFPEGDLIGGPYAENAYYSLNIDYQHQFGEVFNLATGGSYERTNNEDTADRINYNTRTSPFPNGFPYFQSLHHFTGDEGFTSEETRKIMGLYAQGKFNFGKAVKLIIGGRYDDYNDFGDTINPRGALIFDTPFKSKFKIMYGEAFRAPSLTELNIRNNPVVEGNNALTPEEVTTIEAAWVFKTQSFQSTLTYFDSEIENVITVATNSDGVTTYINQGSFETDGIEAEFSAVISQNFFLRGAFTDISGGTSPGVADNSGSLVATFNIANWSANVNAMYRGDTTPFHFYDENGAIVASTVNDSFTLFNAGLRYKVSDTMSFQLNVQNLSDKDYTTYGVIGAPTQIVNRGRTYNMGLIFRP